MEENYSNSEMWRFSKIYDALVSLKNEIDELTIKEVSKQYKVERLVSDVLATIRVYKEKIPDELKQTKFKFDVNKLEKYVLSLQNGFKKSNQKL